MPERVTIPISVFDYSSDYVRPIISIWMDRAALVQSMFDALLKWKLDVNDVEPITTGKPSDQGIKIKLPEKRVTFFFGPSGCKFSREGVDWATADETIEILQTCLTTLVAGSKVELLNQKTAFFLHLQPTTKTFVELIKPLTAHKENDFQTRSLEVADNSYLLVAGACSTPKLPDLPFRYVLAVNGRHHPLTASLRLFERSRKG